MIFGMPTSLFPVLALDVFGTGAAGFGLLAAAPAAGAFLGALFSGWVKSVHRTGRAILVAVTGLGPGHHGLRAGDGLVPARARLPRHRRRGRRLLRGLPLHPRPARDAGQPARPGHVDPHPGRDERATPGRYRGGGGGCPSRRRSSRSCQAGSCASSVSASWPGGSPSSLHHVDPGRATNRLRSTWARPRRRLVSRPQRNRSRRIDPNGPMPDGTKVIVHPPSFSSGSPIQRVFHLKRLRGSSARPCLSRSCCHSPRFRPLRRAVRPCPRAFVTRRSSPGSTTRCRSPSRPMARSSWPKRAARPPLLEPDRTRPRPSSPT